MVRKFVFLGPYITTPNAAALRLRLVSQHRADLKSRPEVIKMGGPFFADEGAGEDATERTVGGTFFLMEAENYAAAREVIESDVFYKDGLWDVPNMKLVEYNPLLGYPF
ncbi:hypothetical protein FB45DRAFT_941930 [Roridomyces roridus]|uniref:YCII-related domain-containing protein n=1 Tax=Roridomyces roridus TaxID=1738132 RepID=A0AAD7B5S8_9AGAR|nr:hypothetical protein FB45DRAFT_941930 [Roridomyces roridus]